MNTLKAFGVQEVVADKYADEWVPEAFRKHGIIVRPSELTASEIYLEFLPLVSNGTVELLDIKRLAGQLAGLERRARSGGKDLVTHYQGGHDRVANAAARVCVRVQKAQKSGVRIWSVSWGSPLRAVPEASGSFPAPCFKSQFCAI